MRIAMVCQPRDRLLASGLLSGSTGIVASELAKCLPPGYALTFYVGSDHGETAAAAGPGGHPVVQVPVEGDRNEQALELLSGLWPGLSARSVAPGYYRGYFARVAELLGREPPDLLHLQTYLQHAPRLRAALPDVPLVLHLHHPHPFGFAPEAAARALDAVDVVVTCSEHLAQRLRAHLPSHAAKFHMIGNGVDSDAFAAPDADAGGASARLLFVGRVSPEKGVHVLAQAFSRVVAVRPEATLEIVGRPGYLPASILPQFGRGPLLEGLRDLYGRNPLVGLSRQVISSRSSYRRTIERRLSPAARAATRFLAAEPFERMPLIYGRSAVAVTPSVIQEPFGLPVVEAMAAGRPVVASRAGGIPELVADGRTGLLVEPGDPLALADALLTLLADPERARAMGAAGRKDAVAHWTWQRAADRLCAVYGSLAAGS